MITFSVPYTVLITATDIADKINAYTGAAAGFAAAVTLMIGTPFVVRGLKPKPRVVSRTVDTITAALTKTRTELESHASDMADKVSLHDRTVVLHEVLRSAADRERERALLIAGNIDTLVGSPA